MAQACKQPVDADFPTLHTWTLGIPPTRLSDRLNVCLCDGIDPFAPKHDALPTWAWHLSASQDS